MLETVLMGNLPQFSLENNLALAKQQGLGLQLSMEALHPLAAQLPRLKHFKQQAQAQQTALAIANYAHYLNPASADAAIAYVAQQRYEEALQMALLLEADSLVVNCPWQPTLRCNGRYSQWKETMLVFLDALGQRYLTDSTLMLFVRNEMDETPQTLQDLVSEVNHPNIKAALDMGHVNLYTGQHPTDWMKKLGGLLGSVVGHNNWGRYNDHAALGEGTMEVDGVLTHAVLSPFKYQMVLEQTSLEALKSSQTLLEKYLKQSPILPSGAQHYLL